jgi:hypothetical protein
VKIRVTKAEILKAIREEPMLAPGWWVAHVAMTSQNQTRQAIPEALTLGQTDVCKVCAVGAVLRRVLPPEVLAKEAYDVAVNAVTGDDCTPMNAYSEESVLADARRVLARSPWNALSYAFEGLCRVHGGLHPYAGLAPEPLAKVREALAKFVEEEFPEDLPLYLGSTAPKDPYKEFTP